MQDQQITVLDVLEERESLHERKKDRSNAQEVHGQSDDNKLLIQKFSQLGILKLSLFVG
jgi:hypothetical protein